MSSNFYYLVGGGAARTFDQSYKLHANKFRASWSMNMASGGKHTPPKKYKSIHIGTSSCCTLCKSTGEIHFKNLFAKANRVLLTTAEDILGKSLEKGELAHLLCRPSERRLNNFRSFKATTIESQSSFERVKRCVEVSPSVPRPMSKSLTDSEKSSRRGLSFGSSSTGKEVRNSSCFQNLFCYFNHFCSSEFFLISYCWPR